MMEEVYLQTFGSISRVCSSSRGETLVKIITSYLGQQLSKLTSPYKFQSAHSQINRKMYHLLMKLIGNSMKPAIRPQNVAINQLFSWASAFRNQPARSKFRQPWATGLVDIFTPDYASPCVPVLAGGVRVGCQVIQAFNRDQGLRKCSGH